MIFLLDIIAWFVCILIAHLAPASLSIEVAALIALAIMGILRILPGDRNLWYPARVP